MKNNIKLFSILISIVICLQFATKSVLSEPFVVLEYRSNNSKSFEVSKNPFLNNENFSKSDFVLNPKAREEKAKLLKRNEEQKIQDAVWKQVDELSGKHQVFYKLQ